MNKMPRPMHCPYCGGPPGLHNAECAVLNYEEGQPMTDDVGKYAAFMDEAARYFDNRPSGGEDSACWANITNAETCRKIAKFLRGVDSRSTKSIDKVEFKSAGDAVAVRSSQHGQMLLSEEEIARAIKDNFGVGYAEDDFGDANEMVPAGVDSRLPTDEALRKAGFESETCPCCNYNGLFSGGAEGMEVGRELFREVLSLSLVSGEKE